MRSRFTRHNVWVSHTRLRSDGEPVHSLRTLLAELATLVRNTCRTPGDLEHPATFDILTTPTPLQRRAFELLEKIKPSSETARSK